MAKKNTTQGKGLRETWEDFLRKATPQQRDDLEEAGFDLADPLDENLPEFHRRFSTAGDDELSEWVTMINRRKDAPADSPKDPLIDFAVVVACKVIDAFDCSADKEVKLHAECMRLAIGMPSCGSQKEVGKRYGKTKAYVSWKVRSIQRRLQLPVCIFNGNRTNK
jgi:hypothetical protein